MFPEFALILILSNAIEAGKCSSTLGLRKSRMMRDLDYEILFFARFCLHELWHALELNNIEIYKFYQF